MREQDLSGCAGPACVWADGGSPDKDSRLALEASVPGDLHQRPYPRVLTTARPRRVAQAKTTRKITLRLTCTNCKSVRLKPIKRAKHFEICDKKPKGKQMY